MNEMDAQKAWRYLNGYHVPRLTDEERKEWSLLIDRLSFDDWQRGCRKSMDRPLDQVHLRPSPMAFRAYARGQAPPRLPEFPLRDEDPITPADRAAMDEVLERWRNRRLA